MEYLAHEKHRKSRTQLIYELHGIREGWERIFDMVVGAN